MYHKWRAYSQFQVLASEAQGCLLVCILAIYLDYLDDPIEFQMVDITYLALLRIDTKFPPVQHFPVARQYVKQFVRFDL